MSVAVEILNSIVEGIHHGDLSVMNRQGRLVSETGLHSYRVLELRHEGTIQSEFLNPLTISVLTNIQESLRILCD